MRLCTAWTPVQEDAVDEDLYFGGVIGNVQHCGSLTLDRELQRMASAYARDLDQSSGLK